MTRSSPRFWANPIGFFDRSYPRIIRWGLWSGLAFATFARGAHDLWASSLLFAGLAFLAGLLIIGCYRTGEPLQLPAWPAVSLFLASQAIALFSSYHFSESLHEVWIWVFVALAFYLTVNTNESSAQNEKFLRWGSYLLIPLACLALSDQFFRPMPNDGFWSLGPWSLRYRRGDIHATLLNSIVMTGFTLSWVFVAWRERRQRWVGTWLVAAAALLLVLGRSWWSIGALTIAVALVFPHRWKWGVVISASPRRPVYLGIALVFVSLLGVKMYHSLPASMESMNRLYWWWSAIQMALQHPWTGVGPGAFATAYPYFRIAGSFGTLYAHSFPLQILAESGFIGFGAFLYLATVLFQHLTRSPTNHPFQRILQASVIVILTYSMIHFSLQFFVNKYVLVLLVAVLFPMGVHGFRLSIWSCAASLAFIIAIVAFSLIPWRASQAYTQGIAAEAADQWDEAESAYSEAIAISPTQGDAWTGLARCSLHAFRLSHDAGDLDQARYQLVESLRWEKDIRTTEFLRQVNNSDRVQ